MDILRSCLTLIGTLLLLMPAIVQGTPLDTAWDLVWAVENGDGEWFMDLMSQSLRLQMETSFLELVELAESEPGLAAEYLISAGLPVSTADLQWMTAPDFVSVLLQQTTIPPSGNIVTENAEMRGRNAEVTMVWMEGFTLDLQMTWEESSWKVTGSSILQQLF
jgi:hypothetical protein